MQSCWNGLVREEQATVAEHARHVADSQGLFERVVVDEHVGRDYQIEQARTLITREAFEHDVQLCSGDVQNRLRPDVDRTRPHLIGERSWDSASRSGAKAIAETTPMLHQCGISLLECGPSCSRSTFDGSADHVLRDDARHAGARERAGDVERRYCRALRNPEAVERIRECEG